MRRLVVHSTLILLVVHGLAACDSREVELLFGMLHVLLVLRRIQGEGGLTLSLMRRSLDDDLWLPLRPKRQSVDVRLLVVPVHPADQLQVFSLICDRVGLLVLGCRSETGFAIMA